MPTLSHLQCKKGEIAPIVLMPSNPAKADRIAQLFSQARNVGRYREFVSWSGTYNGVSVSTISTGIGCPSTAIAVEEAIEAGAKILIRVGTCGGSWREDIPCGSIIIPTACIREEGTTQEYVPLSFPAVADMSVFRCLIEKASAMNIPAFSGINRTHDAFYGSSASKKNWATVLRSSRVEEQIQPILSSEMECSAFFVIASIRGVRAGAILAVNANAESLMAKGGVDVPIMIADSPDAALAEERSIKLALESLPLLEKLL